MLVQNPGAETAQVSLTYMTPEGMVDGPDLELAPESRHSFNVADTVPDAWHVSTKLESNQPVIAERAMYWNSSDVYRQAAHDSIGVTEPSQTWYLAEGSTLINYIGELLIPSPPGTDPSDSPDFLEQFETWVLVQNPSSDVAHVKVTYMTHDGMVDGPEMELAPNTRVSFNVAEILPLTWEVSTKVESNHPIIVERAMYCHYWGGQYYRHSAHCSIGFPGPLELNRH